MRKKLGLKLSKHDVIWSSVFLFMVREKAGLKVASNVFFITFGYKSEPLTLRIRPKLSSDILTFFQLFVSKEYQPAFEFLDKQQINTIIDCGANVGYFSIQALREFPKARTFSIEPGKDNFHELTENLRLNINTSKYKVLNAAIWTKEEWLNINSEKEEWAYQVQRSDSFNGIKGFPLQYIKDKAKFEKIDLLKIDIEGTEDILFKDHSFLAILKNDVRYLVLEIHDHLTNRKSIYNKLTMCGFDFFNKGELTICYKTHE